MIRNSSLMLIYLQTPQVPPFFAQWPQYLQFLQALQALAPVQVAIIFFVGTGLPSAAAAIATISIKCFI